MYNVGYLDDENYEYENYKIDLSIHNIELIKIENIEKKSDLRDTILFFKLDCLIIDYNLSNFKQKEIKDGNELVRYINIEIPDFPCVILTSYPAQSIGEKTIINSFILDRDILTNDTDGEEYLQLVNNIINRIEVYKKRLSLNKKEFDYLFSKKNRGEIVAAEEDRLISLYKILYSYNMIDQINPELLRNDLQNKLNNVIERLQNLLGDKK